MGKKSFYVRFCIGLFCFHCITLNVDVVVVVSRFLCFYLFVCKLARNLDCSTPNSGIFLVHLAIL